jgi:hypothetical protein
LFDRLKARRPDVASATDLVPVGMEALRAQINGFIEHGYSKFVLIPVTEPADFGAELELLAESVLPLEN